MVTTVPVASSSATTGGGGWGGGNILNRPKPQSILGDFFNPGVKTFQTVFIASNSLLCPFTIVSCTPMAAPPATPPSKSLNPQMKQQSWCSIRTMMSQLTGIRCHNWQHVVHFTTWSSTRTRRWRWSRISTNSHSDFLYSTSITLQYRWWTLWSSYEPSSPVTLSGKDIHTKPSNEHIQKCSSSGKMNVSPSVCVQFYRADHWKSPHLLDHCVVSRVFCSHQKGLERIVWTASCLTCLEEEPVWALHKATSRQWARKTVGDPSHPAHNSSHRLRSIRTRTSRREECLSIHVL